MKIRSAAVAGTFYPRDPAQLSADIAEFLKQAKPDGARPRAIIAPHAGYIYSGPIAASAYARVAALGEALKRVVIIGPAHRVPVRGLALSSAEAFQTPLGLVPLDTGAVAQLAGLTQVKVRDDAHALEHCLEVQLPFLQHLFPPKNKTRPAAWTLVPLVAGETSPQEISEVLDVLWDPPSTLVVVSSDLSHYRDYATARKMDAQAARAIETLRPDDLEADQACGRLPICGLLLQARKRHLRARTLDLRNSGDTAGSRGQVVGYGAFAFED